MSAVFVRTSSQKKVKNFCNRQNGSLRRFATDVFDIKDVQTWTGGVNIRAPGVNLLLLVSVKDKSAVTLFSRHRPNPSVQYQHELVMVTILSVIIWKCQNSMKAVKPFKNIY